MRPMKGFKYSKLVQFAADESTMSARSTILTPEDEEELQDTGSYVRFILIFETIRPRGYNKEVEEEYTALLNEKLSKKLMKNDFLAVLPGTLLTRVVSSYAEHEGCKEFSCVNDGYCVDLGSDFVCRCKMEFYGKR